MARSSFEAGRTSPRVGLELASLFDAIYTKFLLGDVITKMLPGGLVIFAVGVFALSPESAWEQLSTMSAWMWLVVLGVAWVMGFVVQMLGNVIITRDAVHKNIHEKAKMDTAYNVIPEIYDADSLDYPGVFYPIWWVQMKQRFMALATRIEMRVYERLNIVKDATGNLGFGLFLSAIILAVYEASDGVYQYQQGEYIYISVFVGLAVALLVWMNHRACEEQFIFMAEVLRRKTGGSDDPEVEE